MSEPRAISAQVIADSVAANSGIRLTTVQLCYPLAIHGEVMTHRVFSRNARSSRAVPTARMIHEVRTDPWVPTHIGRNQKGMQAGAELAGLDRENVVMLWRAAARAAANHAELMAEAGAHKQVVNRVLAAFLWMHTLVSATDWANFFALRLDPAAEPHMRELAFKIYEARKASEPQSLAPGEWHLPYVSDELRATLSEEELIRVSVARCARVSYRDFNGAPTRLEDDLQLYQKLVGSQPMHASPAEHVATPDHYVMLDGHSTGIWAHMGEHGNFTGWRQHRKMLAGECAGAQKTAQRWRRSKITEYRAILKEME